jgi:hypothetical protein
MLGKGQRARERRRDRIRTCREWSSCSVTKPIAGLLVAVSRSWARIPGFSRTVKASNRITRRGRRRGQLTRVASACVWLRQPARGSSRRGQTGAPRPADLRELAHAEVPETAVSLAPGSRQRRRSDLRPAVDRGREAKAEQREARAKDKVFNAFHKAAVVVCAGDGRLRRALRKDRDFNASCQRRMCRQYFVGRAGRLIL